MVEENRWSEPIYTNIINNFINLIGYLNLILNFDSYKESFDEYQQVLFKIINWSVEYERNRDLSFLSFEELEKTYNILDNLQTKYICNDLLGSESEFSDYVLNLFWDLRVIYKNFMKAKGDGVGENTK